MKVLWAPWRMEYILSEKDEGCFLCDLVDAEPSEENLLLFRSRRAMVLMNRYPYNNGHLLVAPLHHTSDPSKLGREDYCETMELFRFSLGVIESVLNPEGFNAGLNLGKSAGAGLEEHLHWHIVPRWQGDTNYMPVISGVRVLPEALAQTYSGLVHRFADFIQWQER